MNENKSRTLVIFLTVFLDLVGFSIIFPLFPGMLEYYFAREGNAGFLGDVIAALSRIGGGEGEEARFRTQVLFGGCLGSLYSILQFICAPLWGSLSDRVGRRPVLLVTISGLAVSYLGWFFSGTFLLLVASRLLGGAMSGNIAVASAAIADTTDEKGRTRGMAVIGMAFGLGFVFGPAIGGILSKVDLPRWIGGEAIGVNPYSAAAGAALLLSVINLVWVRMRFPETLAPELRGKSRTSRPLNPVKLFRRYEARGVNRTNLAYFVYILVFAGMEFTLTFLAKDRFDFGAGQTAGMFVYIGLLIAFAQGGLVRRLAPRVGEKKLALLGLGLLPAGFVLVGLGGSVAMLYVGLAFLAFGSAFIVPSMAGLVSLYSPPEQQGEIQGVFRSLGALGRAVGPIAAGVLYWEYGPRDLYIGGAVLIAVPILLASALPEARRTAPRADEPVKVS